MPFLSTSLLSVVDLPLKYVTEIIVADHPLHLFPIKLYRNIKTTGVQCTCPNERIDVVVVVAPIGYSSVSEQNVEHRKGILNT